MNNIKTKFSLHPDESDWDLPPTQIPAVGTRQRGPSVKVERSWVVAGEEAQVQREAHGQCYWASEKDSSLAANSWGLRPRLTTRIKLRLAYWRRDAPGKENQATKTNGTRSRRHRITAFMSFFLLSASVSMSVKWGHARQGIHNLP